MQTQSAPTDERLVYEIQRSLGLAPEINPRDVNVTVADGVVRLQGILPSAALKERVLEVAREAAGGAELEDSIAVEDGGVGE